MNFKGSVYCISCHDNRVVSAQFCIQYVHVDVGVPQCVYLMHTHSSIGRIKSSEEYARDREFILDSLLQVSTHTHTHM